ncbi:MAG TPA: glutamine-hydrolyzing carbamoyl-phosphate synthase small subunit, partial [Nitrososphaeraceae archaeon]|nr:glutamine-hydrolyzing carbamoyl-phosphate synthase small subunit [Nitrososphaeraceae archaeon]
IPTLESKYTGYNAKLILEDGSLFKGIGFGYPDEIAGEIVFNTGMVGYTEAITDPSYRGQILCMTYPLIGNYGVPSDKIKDKFGLPKFFESEKIQIKGLLIHDLSHIASHWSCIKTLDEWFYEERIPGIYGIDTRELTKKLRIKGVMNGALSVSNDPIDELKLSKLAKSENYEGRNFMPEVSINQPYEYGNNNDNNECIVLLDTGTKYSIIRNIVRIGYRVIRLPWDTTYDKIKSYDPQGVVISNGPGDPRACIATVKTAAELIEESVPTLGICLGNQILALAGGADTYKLKFGHRGQNKPCVDLRNNQTYITSQNHGYGIDPKNLDKTGFNVWFSNIDDNTIEGIEHQSKPIIAVQFHPEASPGPNDCMFIFDRFKEIINNFNKLVKEKKTTTILTKQNIKARKRRKNGKR